MCDLPKMTQQVGLDSRDPGVSARWWSVCPVSQTWTELPGTLYGVGVGGGWRRLEKSLDSELIRGRVTPHPHSLHHQAPCQKSL